MPGPLTRIVTRLKAWRHLNLAAYAATFVANPLAPWPALLPTAELKRLRQVLVVAPHPDDETFGMGGLLLLLRRHGVSLRFLWLTNREESRRVREAGALMASLGCEQDPLDSFPIAGPLPWVHEATSVLTRTLREQPPDVVCCPSVLEPHYDHARVALALRRAVEGSGWRGRVLQYEVWGTVVPNVLVDISSVAAEKERLMRLFQSQLSEPERQYVERLIALNRYRGLALQVEYAEAFMLSDARSYARLAGCSGSVAGVEGAA